MLSFLYRLAAGFESQTGFRPNRLYLSHRHYTQLQSELERINGLERLERFLGMEIVLTKQIPHPSVAWCDEHPEQRAVL